MSQFRWLSVTLFALAGPGALFAQTESLSPFNLPANEFRGIRAVTGLTPAGTLTSDLDVAEELPAPHQCEINLLPAIVSEFLNCWNDQWRLGNYREAALLATLANRLEPTNLVAQHAMALSEIVQKLADGKGTCKAAACGECATAANVASNCTSNYIERRLSLPVSLTFRDAPLHQVIDDLRMLTGVNIIADQVALQEANISLDTPLTLPADKISLKSALNILLDQAKLTYVVSDQVLQITTREKTKGRMKLVTYPIADLVMTVEDCKEFGIQDRNTFLTRHLSTGTTSSENMQTLLINLIQNTIASNSWRGVGGRGTIQYYELGQALVINQTQEVQEDIQALLASLRGLQAHEMRRIQEEVAEHVKLYRVLAKQGRFKEAFAEARKAKELDPDNLAANAAIQLAAIKIAQEYYNNRNQSPEVNSTSGTAAVLSGQITPFGQMNSQCPGGICATGACAQACPVQACETCSGTKVFALTDPVACACDKNCECCKTAAQMMKVLSVMLPPPSLFVSGQAGNDYPYYPYQPTPPLPTEFRTFFTRPVSSADPSQPQAMPLPRPGFGPGMMPMPMPPTPAQVMQDLDCVRRAALEQTAADAQGPKRNVHLVTAHLEANCERLSSSGDRDHVLLEGDVQLTCKSNGQVIRIQGERVLVNMADGTFTVESTPAVHTTTQRMRVQTEPMNYFQPATYTAPVAPWEMVRPFKYDD